MELKYNNKREMLFGILAGFFIGLSVIVPGISGAAIAIALKMYEKLMYSFSNIFKQFKKCITFLLPVALGIIVGVLTGALAVKLLLDLIPFITVCFFVGLMLGTYPIVLEELKGERVNAKKCLLFVFGIIIPVAITLLSVLINTKNSLIGLNFFDYLLFVVIGALASLTQLIPGLSATVLLMIFGYYKALMDSIGIEMIRRPSILLVFLALIIGFVIGVILFSGIISRLLEKRRKPFFFVICGLSIGSMASVFFGYDCLSIYNSWQGNQMIIDIVFGIIALLIGFSATFIMYLRGKRKERKMLKEAQE